MRNLWPVFNILEKILRNLFFFFFKIFVSGWETYWNKRHYKRGAIQYIIYAIHASIWLSFPLNTSKGSVNSVIISLLILKYCTVVCFGNGRLFLMYEAIVYTKTIIHLSCSPSSCSKTYCGTHKSIMFMHAANYNDSEWWPSVNMIQ